MAAYTRDVSVIAADMAISAVKAFARQGMDIYTDDVSLIRVELAWMIRGKPINFKDGEELLVRGEKDGRGKISETHLRALWGKMKPRTSKKAWGDPLWLGQLASCLVNDLKVLTSEQLRQSARGGRTWQEHFTVKNWDTIMLETFLDRFIELTGS